MMHEKIRPHHLERKAILYVRQSSAHQVLHNRESSTLQYAMRDRLTALGWSRVETVDDDLGRSAAGGVTRAGDRYLAPIIAEWRRQQATSALARAVLRPEILRIADPTRNLGAWGAAALAAELIEE